MRSESITAVAALSDTLRGSLYEYIRRQPGPVSRDEAAAHVGISRRLAAFHLDKLTRSGLLRSYYGRPPGAAPGPGRSPKLYEPVDTEFEVSVPPRQYDLIGEILVDTLDTMHTTSAEEVESADSASGVSGDSPARSAALRIAQQRGAEYGSSAREGTRPGPLGPERALGATARVLEPLGYEPLLDEDGALCLRNCPFHRLATRAPALVCGINQAFVRGVLQGLSARSVDAELVPAADRCCVEVRRTTSR